MILIINIYRFDFYLNSQFIWHAFYNFANVCDVIKNARAELSAIRIEKASYQLTHRQNWIRK